MAVWEMESTVYMHRSLRGSCSSALWIVAVSWSQRSLGRHPATLFWHSACQAMSAWTGPPSGPSGVFFVAKEVGTRGWHAGPGAAQPLEAVGSLCSCFTPRVWPCRGSGWQGHTQSASLGAPKPRRLRAYLLAPRDWLASQVEQEPMPELERVVS
jgi:hypothetical protein